MNFLNKICLEFVIKSTTLGTWCKILAVLYLGKLET